MLNRLILNFGSSCLSLPSSLDHRHELPHWLSCYLPKQFLPQSCYFRNDCSVIVFFFFFFPPVRSHVSLRSLQVYLTQENCSNVLKTSAQEVLSICEKQKLMKKTKIRVSYQLAWNQIWDVLLSARCLCGLHILYLLHVNDCTKTSSKIQVDWRHTEVNYLMFVWCSPKLAPELHVTHLQLYVFVLSFTD